MPEGSLDGAPTPNWTCSFCESLGCCRPNSEKGRFESHGDSELGRTTSCLCSGRGPAMVETDLLMRAREEAVVLVVVCRQFLQILEAARRIEGSILRNLE